jgi:NADP-dependent 3-hydroxy acid dehydrogenase YdfG
MRTSNIAAKVVVTPGANSGIGKSTVTSRARHGATVVSEARREDRSDAAVKGISTAGGQAIGFAVDVTTHTEVELAVFWGLINEPSPRERKKEVIGDEFPAPTSAP